MPMDMLNTFDLLKFDCSTVKNLRNGFHIMLYILIGIFNLSGAPISAKTLHCPEFAVVNYSFTQGILCFYQPRRVNHPGSLNDS